jgi:hypothetical protein
MSGCSSLQTGFQEENLVCKRHPSTVGGGSGQSSDCEPDLPMRTDALIRGLDIILEHHECPMSVRLLCDQQIRAYLDPSVSESAWLKSTKYLLTYPLAKYLKRELPEAPTSGPFEPRGRFRAWFNCRLMAFNRRNTHLWSSWFQGKRATLPLSDITVKETYDKHFATLTKEDKGDPETIKKIFDDPTFSRLLTDTTQKISAFLDRCSPFEELSASSSASFEQTRGSGGQQAELRARVGIVSEMMWGTHLERMVWKPFAHGRVRETNCTVEVRGHDGRHLWQHIRALTSTWNVDTPLSCTIQAVLEPNKVRVISKGESIPYYSMRPLQKAMHTALRDVPCFRLIGRPFSATDIEDLRQNAETSWKWFSIDFSGATDGLSWKYSGAIFRCIISQLPIHQFEMAMRVLGPHKLYYPTQNGEKEYRGVQRNGQLMGSVLSFPILCLANLGTYLASTQDLHQGWTDAERLASVLVNGDDMVFPAPEELWEPHVALCKRVGLEMSVGKAYVHHTYLNINSVAVHAPLAQPQVHPWRIDYLNVGLALGRHKVQNRESALGTASCDDRKPEGYTCNINTILDGCLPGRQAQMLRWILREKLDVIQRESMANDGVLRTRIGDRYEQVYAEGLPFEARARTEEYCRRGTYSGIRNLFLPIQIGGMGVIPPADWRFVVFKQHVIFAHQAMISNSAKMAVQLPLPGYEPSSIDSDVNEPWIKTSPEAAENPDGIRRRTRQFQILGRLCRSSTKLKQQRLFVKTISTLVRWDPSPNSWTR